MYIKDSETAHFFGISPWEAWESLEGFSKKLIHIPHHEKGIILLWKERTLYDYTLQSIYDFYRQVGSDILMILCSSLTAARWSGERRWINTQQHNANFNVNICVAVSREVSHQIWNLQERIAVAIAKTLSEIKPENQIQIVYPFHYLMDGSKVAGHLVQKIQLDQNFDFLRIGIGTNTATLPPWLPKNDHLAQYLFSRAHSLDISHDRWIPLAKQYWKNIQIALQWDTSHREYLEYLSMRKWDTIEVYEDNGTTQFGTLISRGIFDTLDSDGSITIDNNVLANREYHIRIIQNLEK